MGINVNRYRIPVMSKVNVNRQDNKSHMVKRCIKTQSVNADFVSAMFLPIDIMSVSVSFSETL